MTDKGPIDQLADLFVFAPIGLALEARALFPRLAQRGREQLHGARSTGGQAATRGRDWAGERIGAAQAEAGAALQGLGLAAVPSSDDGPAGDPPIERTSSSTASPAPAPSRPRAVPSEPPVDVEGLAIPDYDALSASQVVPRLAGLSDDELELVRVYEAGTRGRKTILNKIAQLQAG
jgi:hypothetical protein